MTAEVITLASLTSFPVWVGWQEKVRKDPKTGEGCKTKVPHDPYTGRGADCDDPRTWGLRVKAEAWAKKRSKPGFLSGVGLEFTQVGDFCIGGCDLDRCRDPETGSIAPWALEVIARLNSYTEVSPSGTGVKVFFCYPVTDRPAIEAIFGALLPDMGDPSNEAAATTRRRSRSIAPSGISP
jgi:primase-polymerase (primpol)-like protein